MTKVVSIIDASLRTDHRKVVSDSDKNPTFKLAPSPDAVKKVIQLENAFALADRSLGLLRVG